MPLCDAREASNTGTVGAQSGSVAGAHSQHCRFKRFRCDSKRHACDFFRQRCRLETLRKRRRPATEGEKAAPMPFRTRIHAASNASIATSSGMPATFFANAAALRGYASAEDA
jgi:hypothetical protein